ncbi:MAG: multiple sugar transport system substrate-binding protein [Candidatus Atribacteria bacterium]|nr:multiple sugar transport system substrate-binding protein [Candidatus Atribacteria bacterium]
MSKSRKQLFIGILVVMLVLMISQVVFAAKAWELIDWNKPVPMVERLSNDEYILPEGWEEATKGVKELAIYNSGGLSGDIATAMNMKIFERLTGIKMKVLVVPSTLEDTKTLSILMSKDGSVPLLLAGDPNIGLTTFAREEWLIPLDFLYPQEVKDLYTPALEPLVTRNGHWWASPVTWVGTGTLFYRPSWLKNVGVDIPNNWEDVYIAAQKCRTWAKETLGPDYYGMVFTGTGGNLLQTLQCTIYSQGGRIYKDGKFQFLSEEFKNSFTYWVNMVREDIASQEVFNYDWNDRGTAFGMGKAAFASCMISSYMTSYQTGYPEIKNDWSVLPPPKWDSSSPDEYQSGVALANSNMVNKFSPDNYQAAAMLYLDFIRSAQATRNEIVVEGNDTYYLGHYNDPEAAKKVDWELADRVAKELGVPAPKRIKEIPFPKVRETLLKYSVSEQFPYGFLQVLDEIQFQFSKAATNQVSIEEALQALQNFADSL